MRLWSVHPKYLDARGLVALWREGLLAQAVLRGRTNGYLHHPQLQRFRAQPSPLGAIADYLRAVRGGRQSWLRVRSAKDQPGTWLWYYRRVARAGRARVASSHDEARDARSGDPRSTRMRGALSRTRSFGSFPVTSRRGRRAHDRLPNKPMRLGDD